MRGKRILVGLAILLFVALVVLICFVGLRQNIQPGGTLV